MYREEELEAAIEKYVDSLDIVTLLMSLSSKWV